MGLADIERLGWPACPIVAVRWLHAGQPVSLNVTPGSLAQVVAGRNHIAVIAQQAANAPARLLIVGPDAAVRREISNHQSINDKMEVVDFGWFEKPQRMEDEVFGVVVNLPRGVTYQLDINAASGNVVRVKETR